MVGFKQLHRGGVLNDVVVLRMVLGCLLIGGCSNSAVQSQEKAARLELQVFHDLSSPSIQKRMESLRRIEQAWKLGDMPMLLESARFARHRETWRAIFGLLERKTEQDFQEDLDRAFQWLWNQDVQPHPNYAEFKKTLYSKIDPRFSEYFSDAYPAKIRLDEIRWGGVHRDGIPPLKNPKTISIDAATYLDDSDVVFGVEFGGHARAYPKRILAWHEMVKDVVGDVSICGVYCTLCGAMIVYRTELDGKHHELGTSGFLFRSNKLMYDHETKSMWSTLQGEPVVGPLVDQGIQLEPLHVVTTTWGTWRAMHPKTDVLSLDTGHRRDYGEGVAYRAYFATDELMFGVPHLDGRLKNKDEVLIIRGEFDQPLAISQSFLDRHPIYHLRWEDQSFVVLTDSSGANRVYECGSQRFSLSSVDEIVTDADGVSYRITEHALIPADAATGKRMERFPSHRAFWFGWAAAFPNTKLVK